MLRILVLCPPVLILAACVAPSQPAPAPSPSPAPLPRPAPAPSPAAPVVDWPDREWSPGTWAYAQDARGSIARYGVPGSDAELTLRCDRAARALYLARRGSAPAGAAMTVRTTSTARTLAMQPTGEGYMAARLTPSDGVIDAMGFSRGRFMVQLPPLAPLILPSWAEPLRVAEDCRG
ncbi:hypothetical protein [Sphingomonas baiyangensis]|uniref:Lipoprotein n=1 Tax=Sphingomonas baiyangensis TaxID=2572576 RepID=A0A4U1L9G1_9SPHN|nr:hypothetical protein [Sphingomonas baiyangensis]TKD53193.1 hypothetical protein FBR43_02365 [Sphingomonas baiyangensis]